jgi:hypothetical protein|tara:strand:+ start:110 stop:394 length:285 start_codon:yes stop_codon:yes gene_type:complete
MTDSDLEEVLTDWNSWKSNLKNIYKGIDTDSLYECLDAEEQITRKINNLRNAIWDQNKDLIDSLYPEIMSIIDKHKQDIIVNILKREPYTLSHK